jgi:hypothetical protein
MGAAAPREEPTVRPYWVCVSNEKSGEVTIIGKRPRGIHVSPDGKHLYVALSGSPIAGPPQLNAKGEPIFKPEREEDVDRSADGIGVVDLRQKRLLKKLPSGVDYCKWQD